MEENLFNFLRSELTAALPDMQVLSYFSPLEREEKFIAVGISPLGVIAPGAPFYKAALVIQTGFNRQEISDAAEKVKKTLETARNILAVDRQGTVLAGYMLDGIIPDGNAGSIGPDENDRFITGEITYNIFATKL